MGRCHYRTFYHAVWSTKNRARTITSSVEHYLYPFLRDKARGLRCKVLECNGGADHVHLAITIPPKLCVANVIGILKGAASHHLNKELRVTTGFRWQAGFGIDSISEKDLPRILNYIKRQKEHHRMTR